MRILLALLALLPPAGDGWWSRDWSHRRRILLRNNLDASLRAGHQIQIEFDAAYLGILGKSRADLSDLVLVHRDRPLDLALLPTREKDRRVLWFRTPADIPPRGADEGYALYYGNPGAPAREGSRERIFDFFEDFSRPEALREKFEADRDVTLAVQDGALVIRDVGGTRTENAPARVALKGLPEGPGFALSFDLEIDAPNPQATAMGFAVHIDMKEAAAPDAPALKRIDELVEKLGDPSWELREQATKELFRMGRPAVPKLEAAARSSDAEVRWRAEHLLRVIREHAPSPTITAGVALGDAAVGPAALVHAIGKSRGRSRYAGGWPAKLQVSVLRDPDGEVTVLWNNGRPQTGHLPGEVGRVSFAIWKGVAGAPGTVRVDNLVLRRHVDDDLRPTHTVEVEENRP